MTAPTNPYNAITAAEKQAGKPGKQELFESLDLNTERLWEVMLAAGVSPGDAAVAVAHRHLGPAIDGSATITTQPQENLMAGSSDVEAGGWTEGSHAGQNDIGFAHDVFGSLYEIERASGTVTHLVSVHKAFVSANILKKIKSSGGKGRFTCSMHMKRVAAAAGVVGGTLRFGIWDGTSFVTGAYIDINFDDVTQEYKRFWFTSDQITRPTALNLRSEWTAEPTDWDTISGGDLVGYHGGYMATNGSALAKWDISHLDGGGDAYEADAGNLFYWWDEIITEAEQTV